MTNCSWGSVENWLNQEGFSQKEIRYLAKKLIEDVSLASYSWEEMDVYDLSVENYKNFASYLQVCTIANVMNMVVYSKLMWKMKKLKMN